MTPRARQRTLLSGGAVIVLWLVFKAGPAAVDSIRETRWQLADRVRLLEQSRREIASEQIVFDSATRMKQAIVALAPQLLSGATAAEAADALNGLVSLAADRASARLTGVSSEEDSAATGPLRRIALRAAFDCDVRGLVGMLQFLVDQDAVLATDRLQVVVAEPGGSTSGAEVLRVEMTVRGWYQAGENPVDRLSGP